MAEARPGLGHRPALDGLRALAVIAVLAFHTGVLRAGWIGVDVFFALSGYLITGLLLAEADRFGGIRLGEFWRRRARRLFPAIALLLALIALFDLIGSDAWRGPSRADVWGTVTYTANWVRLAEARSYWDLFTAPSPLEHVWSLAIEEQFYVIWPLVFLLAWRWKGRRGVTIAATVLAGAFSAWQLWLGAAATGGFERIYVGTDTRAPAFLFGALLVAGADAGGRYLRSAARIVPLGITALVVAAVWFDGEARFTYTGGLLAVSMVGAITVWAAARLDRTSLPARLLAVRPLQLVGRWSYGIYLFHWPVVVFVGAQRFDPWVQFAVVSLASIALAAVSYEVVEDRIRGGRLTRRRFAVVALAAAGAFGASLGATAASEPGITTAEREALLTPLTLPATSITPPPTTAGEAATAAAPGTTTAPTADTTTTTIAAGDAPLTRLLVLGDSVPFHLSDAWIDEGTRRGILVAVRAAPGCRPSASAQDQLRSDTAELCTTMLANVGADLAALQPQALVIHYGLADKWIRQAGGLLDACSTAGRDALSAQIESLAEAAALVSARTYVVIPNDPPDGFGLDRTGDNLTGAACYRDTYVRLAAARSDLVTAVRLDTFVCPGGEVDCPGEFANEPLRYDGIHFTDSGASVVVNWMLDDITETSPG